MAPVADHELVEGLKMSPFVPSAGDEHPTITSRVALWP